MSDVIKIYQWIGIHLTCVFINIIVVVCVKDKFSFLYITLKL